ncbi:MAG: HEAT repeat domain-containing protein [Planctomycetes bacterium]|nr:HEAT repeat domain-containing protein [Planctomycetota bacterium]
MNRTKPGFQVALLIVCFTAAWKVPSQGADESQARAIPDFTQGGGRDDSHDWTLGPTGARGWIYGANGRTAEARQILVTDVAEGSPADGVLKEGDVILGVGDRPFDNDARIQFARAVTRAEEEKGRGILTLIRWRGGETQTVTLQLRVLGSYADTAPFDCEKSKRVFEIGCEAIAKRGLRQVSIPNDMNALALLASGEQKYRPLLAEYAKKVADFSTAGFATWHYGYANIFLAEYVIATGDRSVFDGMKRIAMESARGQSGVGTWGHAFAMPSGNLNGYGCMNQPGLSLSISMVLAREAGVADPQLDRAITKAVGFLRWYVDKGAIPYGDHEPYPAHEDNGKCSSAAVLFDLLGDREATEFFAKMSAAAYSERERGHTGNYFNILWALPGVSRCGPVATGAYFHEQSWYYDLARGWDGSVAYQGSPVGAEEHNRYTDWDCTGSYLLAFAASQKSLYMTGKKRCCVPPLNRAQADDVIAAGRDFYPVDGKSGYDTRTTEQLLAGLASWSSAVRRNSAEALARRKADVVPQLQTMLESQSRQSRYGACEALGKLGPAADAAAPQLRKLLNDSDPWLQSLAAMALPALGAEVRKSCVSDLLAMSVRRNPADPRHMAQRAACTALFAPYPGKREPRSILAESLEGVDRQLLYPAVQSALQNEDSVARGSLSRIYGKLTDEDLVVLLPTIAQAVEELAPSNEMFADGVRLAGLDVLSRLHLREGMSLCVSVIEPERWGTGKRLPICLEYLARYGAHAKTVVPQLEELRRRVVQSKRGKEQTEQVRLLDQYIAKITTSKTSPTIIDLKNFDSRSKTAK